MFNLIQEKIKIALGNKESGFWQDKKADNFTWYCKIQTTRLIMFFVVHLINNH